MTPSVRMLMRGAHQHRHDDGRRHHRRVCAWDWDGGVEPSDRGEPWVLDTGATSHFTPDSSRMTDHRKCKEWTLLCAGGGTDPIVGRGNMTLVFRSDGLDVVLHLKNVDHAPCVHHHLLSE